MIFIDVVYIFSFQLQTTAVPLFSAYMMLLSNNFQSLLIKKLQ